MSVCEFVSQRPLSKPKNSANPPYFPCKNGISEGVTFGTPRVTSRKSRERTPTAPLLTEEDHRWDEDLSSDFDVVLYFIYIRLLPDQKLYKDFYERYIYYILYTIYGDGKMKKEEILKVWRQEVAEYKKLVDEGKYEEADREFYEAEIRFAESFDDYYTTTEYSAYPDGRGGDIPVIYFRDGNKYYKLSIADAYDDVVDLAEIDKKTYDENKPF